MRRLAIIGNAGGGKSGLARQLSAAFDIPLHEIDQLQWSPGWVCTDLDEVVRCSRFFWEFCKSGQSERPIIPSTLLEKKLSARIT